LVVSLVDATGGAGAEAMNSRPDKATKKLIHVIAWVVQISRLTGFS